MIMTFTNLQLHPEVTRIISTLGFAEPTEVQSSAIPAIIDGHDVLASSRTGSGKTMAFCAPLVSLILAKEKPTRGLILVPTRELAIQIKDVLFQLREKNNINIVLLFGGSDKRRQAESLKRSVDIIIATPGRLIDHIHSGNVRLANFNFFVLDEFDRMLDMGFKENVAEIYAKLSKECQTIMFSATLDEKITSLARQYLKSPKEISIKQKEEGHAHITQNFLEISHRDKMTHFLKELNTDGSILVFVNTKSKADDLMYQVNNLGLESQSLHGDLRQREREFVTKGFRNGKYKILIATDVAARGLDISHIELVINFDLPKNFDDYTHRIGRTGRAGKHGRVISFVTENDRTAYHNIKNKGKTPSNDRNYRSAGAKARPSFGFSRTRDGDAGRESSFRGAPKTGFRGGERRPDSKRNERREGTRNEHFE